MAKWTAFPHVGDYQFDAASVKKYWARLHTGDAEPLPRDLQVLEAWVQFHNGEFQKAVEAGLKAGGAGITAANKAACIYATYLEKREKARLDLYLEVAGRAEAQAAQDPQNPNAHYWQAYALGRYSQGISVAKALAQGLGSKVKTALETAIKLQPRHADAHIALGAFHAEVIDKVGSLLGRTQGASKDQGLLMYKTALKQNPNPHYWQAYALGRYSRGISVAKALAQGLGGKVKNALENTIKLQPKHADAHVALGAFHAEVIDKVGSLIGGMTYGAKKDTGLQLFQQALKLNFESAIAMIEYANAMVMLDGDKMMKEATRLYQLAAAAKPMDAMERLDVEMAKAELED